MILVMAKWDRGYVLVLIDMCGVANCVFGNAALRDGRMNWWIS